MDEADRAQQEIEVQEQHARRCVWYPELKATGWCLYCGASVLPGIRWCCPECAWSTEYELQRKQAHGKA